MKKKEENNNIVNNLKVTLAFILLSVVLLSFAYASYSTTASMENILAQVRPTGNVVITNMVLQGVSNGATSSSESYNVSSVYSSIYLPNADSTVTYRVDATVLSSSEMKISSITGLDSDLEFSFSNYDIGDVLCDSHDECTHGATDQLLITIGYKQGAYTGNNTNYAVSLIFNFEVVNYVARIGSTRYTTLKKAVEAVPKSNTQTTVILLKNTSDRITVDANQNVLFNLQSFTLSNDGKAPVISNNGTITINNGTITSNTSQGAINNESTGTLYMSGGQIIATGSRQAIYNNGGTAYISGSAYLSATTAERGTVHNLASGTLVVTGGTILSTGLYGIDNYATLTIGDNDGSVNRSSPLIKGEVYGINTTPAFDFYDGVIEGKTDAVNDEQLIDDIETGNEILHAMDGAYKKISLGLKITITFNANGGSVGEASREISQGAQIGSLPTPNWPGYDFLGWFTSSSGGTEVLATTTFNSNDTIYAHWEESHNYLARIGENYYDSLQDAVNAVANDNVKVVITVLQDIGDVNITVGNNKNVEFDLGSYTLSSDAGIIIDNRGTIEIKNGKLIRNGANDENRVIVNRSGGNVTISGGEIKSNCHQAIRNYGTMSITGGKIWVANSVDQGVINNESGGNITISGGQILGTKRQGLYNDGGTATITGTVTFSNGNGVNANRACVQNHRGTMTISGGTITSPASSYPAMLNEASTTITGGTITSSAQNGVNNTSTLIIGSKDGNINASNPSITGFVNGVNNTSTLKFYDGIIKGINKSINGSVNEYEDNSTRIDDTEDIGGNTYHTTHLE